MSAFPPIPFKVDAVVTTGTASGVDYPNGLPWELGSLFGDKGKVYILLKIDPALINNAFANNEVACLKAGWVATNDVSDAVESGTYPIVCGVARGALDESTSTTTVRHGLFQVWGRGTVKTNGDDDIAAGVRLIAATSTDGACDSLAGSSTSADGIIQNMTVGFSADVDTDAANTVEAFIRVGLCF